jgi:hypothetical protein
MQNGIFAGSVPVASLAVALVFATSAGAADIASPPETPPQVTELAIPAYEGWVFQATMYGWAVALTGNLRTTPALKEVHAFLPFTTILDHLDGVFMGAFEAKYGRFVLYNDLVYAKIGAAGNFDRRDFSFGLSLSSTIATDIATAGYRLIDDPRFSVDALGWCARILHRQHDLGAGQPAADAFDRLRIGQKLGDPGGGGSCPLQLHR